MVSFLAHNRQWTIAGIVVLLIMLVGLLPVPHPALAQSAVTLNSTSGLPGTGIIATGSGWPAGHQVKVQWYDGTELAATAVDSNGSFTVSFIVPANAGEGQYIVYFYDFLPEGRVGIFHPCNFHGHSLLSYADSYAQRLLRHDRRHDYSAREGLGPGW